MYEKCYINKVALPCLPLRTQKGISNERCGNGLIGLHEAKTETLAALWGLVPGCTAGGSGIEGEVKGALGLTFVLR